MGPALAIAVAVTLIAGADTDPRGGIAARPAGVLQPSRSWRRGTAGRAVHRHRPRPGAHSSPASSRPSPALVLGGPGHRRVRLPSRHSTWSSAGIPASAGIGDRAAGQPWRSGLPPGATDPAYVLLHTTSRLAAVLGPRIKRLRREAEDAEPAVGAGRDAEAELQSRATADYLVTLSHDPQSTAAVERDEEHCWKCQAPTRPRRRARTCALVGGTTSVFADILEARAGQPRLCGGVPGTPRVIILLILEPAAAQRGGAVVPDGLGRPRVRARPWALQACWCSSTSAASQGWFSCCRCTCTCSWSRWVPTTTS